MDRPRSLGFRCCRSTARDCIFSRARTAGLHSAWRRFSCRDRRRGALRRHGPFRQAAHPIRVVLARAAGAAVQLLRPGCALVARCAGCAAAVLLARAGMGTLSTRGSRDGCRDHRLSGAHLRRVLADAASHPARIRSAAGCRTHVVAGSGTDLCSAGQRRPRSRNNPNCDRIQILERAGCGIRHCSDNDDGHHGLAATRYCNGTLEMAPSGRIGRDGVISYDRSFVLRREPAEGAARRLAATRHGYSHLHADDHVEDRPPHRRGTVERARYSARTVHGCRHGDAPDSSARHRGVHDCAAARHSAGARAQPALQQDSSRARDRAQRIHGANTICRGEGSTLGGETRQRRIRHTDTIRVHAGSERPGDAQSGEKYGSGDGS